MNSRIVWALVGLTACLILGVSDVEAKKNWKKLATLTAGGGAKEVAVNMDCDQFLIHIKEGPVIINTIVVREGSKTTPIRIGQRFEKGQKHEFSIPSKVRVTGLRISDDGRGQYEVFVRH